MNKRIPTLFLCLVMVVAMLVSAVPVFAEPSVHPAITFTIKPDKTTAKPGDTIAYQAILGPVKKLQSAQFKLVIPEELEFIGGSCPDGLAAKLGAATAEFAPSTKVYGSYGAGEYTSTGDTVLVNFTCKVKEGVAAGKKPVVTVMDGEENLVFSDSDEGDYELHFDPNSSMVTVAAAPKPATGISLNKAALSLTVGGSEQLNATVQPADTTDTVKWSSDKLAIAKVDNTGKVTAVAPGTANITAKAGNKTAVCKVTVTAAPKPATGITLNKDQLSMVIGTNEKLTAKPEPADTTDTVKWSSDKPEIAKVDNTGKVTAVSSGTAIIKATVGNHTAECTVNVEKTVRIELPYKLIVKKTGEMDPGKESFKFVIEKFGAPSDYSTVQDSIMTEGEKTYDGKFIFDIREGMTGNLSEGFVFRQVKGDAAGWTYDETAYYAVPRFTDNGLSAWEFYGLKEDEMPDMDNPMEEISFTNSYNAKKPETPPVQSEPESPKTGENGMTVLWLALLFVSGAALMGTTLYSRKMSADNR